MKVFGKRLRQRGGELELSSAEVARRAGLSERRYGHYVTGAREPDLETLLKICKVLGSTPNHLLGIGDEEAGEDKKRVASRARLLSAANALETENLQLAAKQVEALLRHQRGRKGGN